MTTTIPPTTTIAARAVNASKIYGKGDTAVHALDNIDVAFDRARYTAIMGPSGSGKSTLLHCLAGLDVVTAGRVLVDEQDLATLSDRELTVLRRTRIGFVFQAYNLVPTMTALENVVLPFTLGGARPDPAWLDTVVSTVGLRDRLRRRPNELSGGQQQRVAVARALVTRPEIVFADEPTGNLDSRAGAEVLGFLRRAVDDFDQTVVMVTHDAIAASFADAVVFLADGRVVDHMDMPTTERVFDRMRAFDRPLDGTHETGA
ncbi:MAG TPA: ABC transporter ATP-binding protein [Acidimicrobiia bacterium]|nr:ABC transporter ATP-binding protein [Acidimicrobiia bacterium]